MAVDLLVDMMHRNERGIPPIPYRLMVEGSWCEGKTLLSLHRSQAPVGLGAMQAKSTV
jgi:hypothetical protein